MHPRPVKPTRALSVAIGVLAVVCAAAVAAPSAPAQSAIAKLGAVQAKLDQTRGKEHATTSQISDYNKRIDDLRGQIAELRNQEADLAARLQQLQAELETEQAQLEALHEQLKRAISTLESRLVDIYKSNDPDVLTIVLNSDGFDDLLARSDYLQRIQSLESGIVGRVRELRDQTKQIVDRITAQRDEVAAKKAVFDRTKAELAQRTSEYAQARDKQRKALASIRDHRKNLEGDLSKISKQVTAQLGGGAALVAGPIRDGGHGLIWPVNGPITSPFGGRNIGNGYEFHPGVDIGAATGTPIRAAAAGTVAIAAPSGGYGNYTCIDHGGGLSTCYGHQEKFLVVAGQHVSQGQPIGLSDCTGYCFGPHVHFEVRINGEVTDPLNYF
jgi:murein DD-endopeptidase MepM/ murein hydrolase activator NlpD